MNRPLLALVASAILASACTTPGVQADVAIGAAPRASAAPADAASAAAAVNAFGLDLYLKVAGASARTNVVLSPASIALALSMARAGAKGETATQMDAVLRSLATDGHGGWVNALDAALAARNGTFKDQTGADLPVTLRIANAPFAQRGYPFEPAFLDALSSRFGAGVRLVDYKADPEAGRVTINAWVKDQTEARIPELLASGTVNEMARLVLVNAIYLKAPWLTPFSADATVPGPFHRADGSSVSARMMSLGSELPYAEGAGWKAVELPYVGGSLAMDVIVPDDLATFEGTLTDVRLAEITSSFGTKHVLLTMPKFSLETLTELRSVLSALGMPLAFDQNKADFSGMTAVEKLYVSAVVHQANIDVDEKGTTAAAATAVVMMATGMPVQPEILKADRPFLFVLRDLPTGAVLFLGRVTDPSTK